MKSCRITCSMPDLTKSTTTAKITKVYSLTGRVKCHSLSIRSLPKGYCDGYADWAPPAGNILSLYPNTRMNTIPKKNMGMDVPTRAVLLTVTSSFEYLLRADKIPIGIAIIKERTRPISWISRVNQERSANKVETGIFSPLVYETAKKRRNSGQFSGATPIAEKVVRLTCW